MSDKPVFQELFQEETLFPFAWKLVENPVPCCPRIGDRELPLDAQSLLRLGEARSSELHGLLMGGELAGCPPQFHLHDHCQITQCVSGRMIYLFESDAVALAPGDILLVNAMTPHTWIAAEPGTARYQLGFYPQALSANLYNQCFLPYFRLLYSQHTPALHLRAGEAGFEGASQCMRQIEDAYRRKGFAFDAAIHDRLFDLSAQLLPSILGGERLEAGLSLRDRTIQKALSYIDEHIAGELSMQSVASHVGLNPSYFSVYFKKHLGVPYKKYVLTQKVTRAANALQYSDAAVTEILFECGFSSVSSFYQAFHRVYTMSPAQFRKLTTQRIATVPCKFPNAAKIG